MEIQYLEDGIFPNVPASKPLGNRKFTNTCRYPVGKSVGTRVPDADVRRNKFFILTNLYVETSVP